MELILKDFLCKSYLLCKADDTERFLNEFSVSFIISQLLKSFVNMQFNAFSRSNMHILQPKHTKLNEKEAEELLKKLNISKAQLPKIFLDDAGVPEECNIGDIIKIERREGDKINIYFRAVV